jgi:hypothetical protein
MYKGIYRGVSLFHSLTAIVTQPKNCPFRVNTKIELRNVTTIYKNRDTTS